MKFNKKTFLKSLYKISVVLFLIGYNFAPSLLAINQLRDIGGEITPVAAADTVNATASSSGKWTWVDDSDILVPGTLHTNWIKWDKWGWQYSGLEFIGKPTFSINGEQEFELGTLKHHNYPVNYAIEEATLSVTINLGAPISQTKVFNMNLQIEETPNSGTCAPWHTPGNPKCDDRITFPTVYSKEFFTIGETRYVLEITGFIKDGQNVTQFITKEGDTNEAIIRGRLRSVPAKVTICHASDSHTNQYITHAPSADGNVGGHAGHNGPIWYPGITEAWGDIIPEFRYFDSNGNVQVYPGKNNTEYGLSILENGCVFPQGKITVNKVVIPAGDPTSFTITGTGVPAVADSPTTFIGSNTGTISGTTSATFDVYPGKYTFVETAKEGWIETANTCNNVTVEKCNDKKCTNAATCTITNTQASTLTIVKHAEQVSDTQFNFTTIGNGLSNFSLVDNDANNDPKKVFTNLLPGEYSVTEDTKDGWDLKSAVCDNGQTPNALNLTAGSNVTCTFTNTQRGSLTIVKNAIPSSEEVFSFTTTGTGLSTFTLVDNSDTNNPSKVFKNLLPGTYSVSETVPSNWYLDGATCSDGSPITAIDLSAGENITCTFNNVKYGSISGYKYEDADNSDETTTDRTPVSGWTIILKNKDGDEIDRTTTNASGYYEFTELLPADYIVTEGLEVGWIVLVGASKDVTLDAGENEEVNFVNVKLGSIKVLKNVDKNGDGIIDQEDSTEWSWTLNGTNAGATGTTKSDLEPGMYTIKETGGLANYHFVSLTCTGAASERITITGDTAKIDLRSGEDVVCTYTNARNLGKLIIEKEVINDNGGSKKATDFSFQIDSEDAILFTQNGDDELKGRNEYTRYAGLSYTITEPEANQDGYTTTYSNCEDIVVPHNGEVICKITNNDVAPTLTVIKNVVNDNGGTAIINDFGIKLNNDLITFGEGVVEGATTIYTSTPTIVSNTEYTLSEKDLAGYEEGAWSCVDNNTENNVTNPFTLAEGQSVTCTITNDDIAPSLQLVKVVNNNYGGEAKVTDWTLTATGPTTISGKGGVTSGNNFAAGTYTLSESGDVTGYDASSWSCTNGVTVDANNGITLGVGKSTVCTITNSDVQPTLKLVKVVSNNHGGKKEVADFNLYIGNIKVNSGVATDVNANTQYVVREDQLPGYTASVWSGDCSADGKITLLPGENKTCYITNSDSQSKITVIKKVINDNGGTATVDDFNITLTDSTLEFDAGVEEGDTTTYTATIFGDVNKEYTLSETVIGTGYHQESLKCSLGTNGVFTLPEGQDVTCTIVNNDIAPKLTLVKEVNNKNLPDDLQKSPSDWNLKAEGPTSINGDGGVTSEDNFKAGTYTLSETSIPGFKSVNGWDCGEATVEEGNKITLKVGDVVTCKIINESVHGKIIIKKLVEPSTDTTTFDFTGTVEGTIGHNGELEKIVVPGEGYSVIETPMEGWNLKSLKCIDSLSGDSFQDGENKYKVNIWVADNETVTCTFTNEKLGKISGYKYEDKNGNGLWDEGEPALKGWTINNGLGGSTTTNDDGYYEFTNLPVGNTYTITETQQDGWTQTSTNPSAITIAAGNDIKDINFGNFKHVTINVTKDVVGIDEETEVKDSTEFVALLNGDDGKTIAEETFAEYIVKKPGKYTVSEGPNENYKNYKDLGCFLGDEEFSDYVVESGQTYDVVCKNAQLPATLIVTKDVVNSEGEDVDGDIFSDDQFDVVLGEETQQIADTANGKKPAIFEGLQPGVHTFTETPKEGYTFGGCTDDGEVTLGSNQTLEVECINKVIDPLLNIEKSNDKQHIDQYAGDIVTYTITVTAPDDESEGTYVLSDVVVSDIAPAGFKYISDSWTAQKNGVDIPVPEPTYDDKGQAKWNIGDMKEGDVIVLTYKTKISLLQDPGNYPDIAWVSGRSLIDGAVLGASTVDPLTPFVGTDVTVIEPVETEEGEVLGASITLPVTGASTYLTLGALIMMILGAITLLLKPFKKLSYALLTGLMAVSFVTLFTPNRVLAANEDIKVRIMQPATPTKKSTFNVGFVALDLNNEPITVECYKDAVLFETIPNVNTGNCSAKVDASGTYTFYVVAKSISGEQKSADVTVVVDLEKPAPVIDYSKAGNVIKFKTPNDGKTKKVEIHRSTTSKYTANEGTRVHTMDVLPNTEYSWTDTTAEAGKTYYYALRTVDAVGNVSTMVSDPEVVEVPTVSTPTATTTTGEEVAGQKDTTEEGEVAGETDDVSEGEDQEVEKTEDSTEKTDIKETAKKAAGKWYIWVIAIVVIGGVAYYVRKQKRD